MATGISAKISLSDVLHPDIGARGKWNFPQDGTAGGDLSTTGTERVSPRGGFRRRRVPRSVTRRLDNSPTGLKA